jgi:hypothetical protein
MRDSNINRAFEPRSTRVASTLPAEANAGGYTTLPNALLRIWIPALSGAEIAVLMWVIQDTLAWHRDRTKPATFRFIAQRTNLHRHSIERAMATLTEIGLITIRDAEENAGAYAQVFVIDAFLLQNPPLEFEALVQKMDQLRTGDWSQKGTDVVKKRDTISPKMGPTLVQKEDRSYKEEIKELKESKKLASADSQELEQEIRDRIVRSRLSTLGRTPLDTRTVANIRNQIERLSADWQAKEVLETMEHKCAEFARNPRMAESWGLVVTVVRDAVVQTLTRPAEDAEPRDGGFTQKPWHWMTTEERTAAREAAERIA